MKTLRIFGAVLATLTLFACTDANMGDRDPAPVAARALRALCANDWSTLANLAHPNHGVRFSPYAYVDTTDGVVLSSAEIRALGDGSQRRRWGIFDGSGEPIELSVQTYFERFVCDSALANAEPGPPNVRIGRGNSIDNIGEVYTGRNIVFFEYYAPGTEKYARMDWRSLRLVLERTGGRWYLIAVVHDQWTI